MQLSSAKLNPIRHTSSHETKLIWFGIVLCGFVLSSYLIEGVGRELAGFTTGVAGAAFVQFAQSEAATWRRPMTLGHQLVFWWFWVLVLPVFAILTRHRRSPGLTVLLVVPFVAHLFLVVFLAFRDALRFFG
jgi:hypothetical protein